MRSIKFIAIFVSFFFLLNAEAQKRNNKTLLKIDHEKISLNEFLDAYHKSNINLNTDSSSVHDYLDLYINFRLKVLDAKNLKIDTTTSFKKELEGYKKQLAQPFFLDKKTNNLLLKEAYERLLVDVRVSHLLVHCEVNANPSDTLKAFKRIMAFKKRIQDGEDLQSLASLYSDDLSARNQTDNRNNIIREGNRGDLGFFTVFDMVYPFENAAYKLPIDSISDPIRTRFGYHLIKVTDRHEAIGKVKLAQIFLRNPYPNRSDAETKEQIFKIHSKLKSGESFEKLVMKYSEDQSSKSQNGILPEFKANDLLPDFYWGIFNINDSTAYSKPVKTSLGWHIIKLIQQEKPKTFEEEKSFLTDQINKDERKGLSKLTKLNQVKKEYRIKTFKKAKSILYSQIDSSLLKGNWYSAPDTDLNFKLSKIGNKVLTQKDFVQYIYKNQQLQNVFNLSSYYEYLYEGFIDSISEEYFYNELENKEAEFKKIMDEYRDGLLLFEITERKVWNKSVSDVKGLMSYFNSNQNKYGNQDFNNIKGIIISDYQDHLEKVWLKELKSKHSIIINQKLLSQF